MHVIKIGAEWCGPCKVLSKTISNLNVEKVNGVLFGEVDIEIEENDDIVSEYGIRNIPVVLFIKNSELLEKKVGSMTADELYKHIENYK